MLIDLTHTLTEQAEVFPGSKPPSLSTVAEVETDGFKESELTFYSHTGTHVDAPSHIYKDRLFLEEVPVSQLIGKACLIDATEVIDRSITLEHLEPVLKEAREADFLIFYTGWGRKYGSEGYFYDYPLLSDEVLDFILETEKKGIGSDTMSLDDVFHDQVRRHRKLLKDQDILIFENLTNLDLIRTTTFTFIGLPLKYKNSDGAPVRAVAMVE